VKRYGRVTVLAGGPSSERQISIKSGEAVYKALARIKVDANLMDADDDFPEKIKKEKPDIVFIALHGRFGEDGSVQTILEELGIPYIGSGVRASKLALDKIASREIFFANGITVPRYTVFEKEKGRQGLLSDFTVPFVVKPQNEGSSIGLTVVREPSALGEALEKALRYDKKVLVEEYIHGKEITVGILGERALPVVEIVVKNQVYDYDAKYEDKDTLYVVPADLAKDDYEKAQAIALKAHNTLGCRDFSRVDMRMDEERDISVLEVNTIPGMTERSLLPKAAAASGITFEDLCLKLINMADKRRKA